jgi:hypothetical protein
MDRSVLRGAFWMAAAAATTKQKVERKLCARAGVVTDARISTAARFCRFLRRSRVGHGQGPRGLGAAQAKRRPWPCVNHSRNAHGGLRGPAAVAFPLLVAGTDWPGHSRPHVIWKRVTFTCGGPAWMLPVQGAWRALVALGSTKGLVHFLNTSIGGIDGRWRRPPRCYRPCMRGSCPAPARVLPPGQTNKAFSSCFYYIILSLLAFDLSSTAPHTLPLALDFHFDRFNSFFIFILFFLLTYQKAATSPPTSTSSSLNTDAQTRCGSPRRDPVAPRRRGAAAAAPPAPSPRTPVRTPDRSRP